MIVTANLVAAALHTELVSPKTLNVKMAEYVPTREGSEMSGTE